MIHLWWRHGRRHILRTRRLSSLPMDRQITPTLWVLSLTLARKDWELVPGDSHFWWMTWRWRQQMWNLVENLLSPVLTISSRLFKILIMCKSYCTQVAFEDVCLENPLLEICHACWTNGYVSLFFAWRCVSGKSIAWVETLNPLFLSTYCVILLNDEKRFFFFCYTQTSICIG